MKTRNKHKDLRSRILLFVITAIPNPDPREPSPDLTRSDEDSFSADEDDRPLDTDQDNEDPNTDLSGIKDDRTHDVEEAQAEQRKKDDDKPDLSGEINV
ncbi:hypothetical protein BWD42_12270 [Sphingobacterium sp. CZ-UAM]|uniref:hypothetical protein n=1 Tax=Sphingobacterium sp. CZ-UAM TaxID=1933868 RepID=UPI0009862ED1|nr:hypothetical protein [Sphingobacterium sp. CZ-UAM]OOG18055.1 hypothetical protein BWD42_12270 [Sphingobacterium sp. CZ-UAM]